MSILPNTDEQLHTEIERLRQALHTRETQLHDLLAAIHHDNGEHTRERGIALSCTDAHVKLARLRERAIDPEAQTRKDAKHERKQSLQRAMNKNARIAELEADNSAEAALEEADG